MTYSFFTPKTLQRNEIYPDKDIGPSDFRPFSLKIPTMRVKPYYLEANKTSEETFDGLCRKRLVGTMA